MTLNPQRFQFYGRRKGKPLRRHHLHLIDELLPTLKCDPSTVDPSTENWLEIGFGGGEHLAHQAELHTQVRFIGAEPYLNGVAKLLNLIEAKGLNNIRIHDEDARFLLQALPDSCLSRVYLLYPDPWPKARQTKRRFVNDDNLAAIARVLKPAGHFYFATDIADYVEWTLLALQRLPRFTLLEQSTQPFENWIETRFETKAKAAGRQSQYLRYRLD